MDVTKLSGGFTTSYEYLITGTEEECKEWIKSYLAQYHPAGYGTTVRKIKVHEPGQVTYRIWRSYTCD
jgi:hypothetical protein